MTRWRVVGFVFICVFLAGTSVAAIEENRYSYITVKDIEISLQGDQATVNIDYDIDMPIQWLVLLLGKSDLQNKITYILNFNEPRYTRLTLDHAEVIVEKAAFDYQDGTYWFPAHTFNVVVPNLKIQTPQVTREFSYVNKLPDGIGYFWP
ncbi:MAG: hypothetical protein ACXQTG_02960 [Methanoculleaceae archaeon]